MNATTKSDKTPKIFSMSFASVYICYVNKIERKNRNVSELDTVLTWLTGYDKKSLHQQIKNKVDFVTFFKDAPMINPNISKITGVICGIRVEDMEEGLMKQIRYMDKLVDELAKGRSMEKILRK
jgi:hypothetical protein